MKNESMGIPQNEEHLEALEATILQLKEIIKQKESVLSKHANILKDLEELSVIINGLCQKAESLIEEDKRLSAKEP
jgi:translation initiation factor 2 gamma subunit (eIF-2gamma)